MKNIKIRNGKCALKNGQGVCCQKRDLTHKQIKKLQKKTKLPLCDGTSYPYIMECGVDASNWSAPKKDGSPKQCIIINPATTNLQSGSIYTCGFLW